MRQKIIIPKNDLIRLYCVENQSKYKIGKIYQCSFKTVLNRLRDYGIEPVSRSIMQSKYKKKDFSGDNEEKAYILGFRIGDLNVYKTNSKSEVVVVRCHTTKDDQVELIKNLFSKYGQVSVAKNTNNGSYSVNCFLNSTFNFLVNKSDWVDDWITADKKLSLAFMAGYVDAEGNIGVYDGRARFKIDSYDKNIIKWIYQLLIKNGVLCSPPKMIASKGHIYNIKLNYKYSNDLWRIRVSDKGSLLKLLTALLPYLKHEKRLLDLHKCLKNINDRNTKKN